MRVASKRIHARNDCFDAAEGSSSVRIATHRHTVLVSAQDRMGNAVTREFSNFEDFAQAIVWAVEKEQGNER